MRRAVIIGAGPAGLTAAYQLLKETDVMPVIYEAEPFVGGISRTASYAGGRLDIGPHRFFSKSPEVNAIWSELMPTQGAPSKDDRLTGAGHNKHLAPGGPDPDKANALWLIRDRITRILFDGKLFDYPVSLKAQTLINMGVARTIRAGVGYVAARLRKREERSLEDFYINRFGKPLYSLFFEDYTEKLWGVHPSQISAEWGAQRVKELSVWKILVEGAAKLVRKNHKTNTTSLIERFIYPKNGAGELYGVMANRIAEMGGVIKLGARVKALRVSEGRVVGAEIDGPDGYAPGDLFFSTMPVKDLVSALGAGGGASASASSTSAARATRCGTWATTTSCATPSASLGAATPCTGGSSTRRTSSPRRSSASKRRIRRTSGHTRSSTRSGACWTASRTCTAWAATASTATTTWITRC
ncbi:MAG: NAD(P)-binding protein [Synergistaceae bacterium]|jgi:protoporphyrinogen oxidase|nr:NAD(P)-binding protein [Synergistaceae bacterium]